MKKLLNFLLVHRPETENKRWHRLFTVLLFGSSIIVFIIAVFSAVVSYNNTWVNYGNQPLAFSSEPDYERISGKELSCDRRPTFSNKKLIWIVECNGTRLSAFDAERYESVYELAREDLEKQLGLDKYDSANCSPTLSTIEERFNCIERFADEMKADPAYPEYENLLKDISSIKVVRDIDFGTMFSDIALWVIIPIFVLVLWIIFWSSVVYRSVLYIVFGKK